MVAVLVLLADDDDTPLDLAHMMMVMMNKHERESIL